MTKHYSKFYQEMQPFFEQLTFSPAEAKVKRLKMLQRTMRGRLHLHSQLAYHLYLYDRSFYEFLPRRLKA